jgi:hypothetical protein
LTVDEIEGCATMIRVLLVVLIVLARPPQAADCAVTV